MEKEKILDAYNFRHACKEFDVEKKISEEDFKFILETGRLSPSSFGFEPWHFVVVQNKDKREMLKESAWGAGPKLDTASHFVLCLTLRPKYMRYDSEYLDDFLRNVKKLPENVIGMMKGFCENFQKNDFDLNTDRAILDWTTKQSYIPLANMITSAAMIGIDSCPMEGFKQKETEELLGTRTFGIDIEKYSLSYMVAFGYRKNEAPQKIRRPIEDVVSWQ